MRPVLMLESLERKGTLHHKGEKGPATWEGGAEQSRGVGRELGAGPGGAGLGLAWLLSPNRQRSRRGGGEEGGGRGDQELRFEQRRGKERRGEGPGTEVVVE
ncbi:hypothetical protein AXG93_2839s1390 [Marchantia polymorpha subsp. ruderalis]|uniref:Uncharacterized protein n=1 Tax=Marchantia polymorpha subsp. ruderalis TaxID=1480154 RepID=A0A176VF22_MARPO|nr:hypothetical protein AXG93_2839s1390 [Marchantia polymorpha subsp. ruderalis]